MSFIEYNKLIELREIETFIYEQLRLLIKYDYFWQNIDDIINILISNYNTENNYNKWIFYKGCIMTFNNNILEIDEVLTNYNKKESILFEKINDNYKKLVNEVNDNTNVQLISKGKKEQEMIELLDELILDFKEQNNLRKIESLEKKLINNLDENSYSELIKLKSQLNRE